MSASSPRISLVTRTTLWILGVVALVGVISLLWSNGLAVERENARTQKQLQELLDMVERPVSIACFLGDWQLADEVIRGLLSNQIVAQVVIYAAEAEPLAKATRATVPDPADSATFIVRRLKSPFNPHEFVGEIRLAPDPVQINQRVAEASSFIAILLIVQLLAIGGTVAWVVYGLITRPLRQVADGLRTLPAEKGDKLPHPAGHEGDEIGRVVSYINHLVERLMGLLNAERGLRLQQEIEERKFRSIFENAGTGIFLIGQSGEMLSYNAACQQILQAAGRVAADPIPGIVSLFDEDEEQVRLFIDACQQGNQHVQQDICLIGKDGRPDRWVHVTLSKIEDGVFQGVVNDITERKLSEAAAQEIAMTDALTRLLNRLGFETRLQERLYRCFYKKTSHVALMLLDVDFFKQVNDLYGHEAGDQVLVHVARLLESVVRRSDLVGRLGGDEFVILLEDIEQCETLENIARKMLARIAEPIDVGGGRSAQVGFSIGIAMIEGEAIGWKSLYKLADEAMYQVKKDGRNAYCIRTDS